MAFPHDAHAIVMASATMHSQTSSSLRGASPCPTRRSGCAREVSSFPDETGGYIQGRARLRLCEWHRPLFPHHSWSEQMAFRKKRVFLLGLQRLPAGYERSVGCKAQQLEHSYPSAALQNFRQDEVCEFLRTTSPPAKQYALRRQQNG